MLPTRLVRVAIVAGAVLAVACGDPTRPRATYANAANTYTLYTLTNSPAVSPNALSFLGGVSRANGAFAFDVAFDLDATGRPVVYPVRLIGGAAAGTLKRVGLQVVSGAYESVTEVPSTGYDTLNTKVLLPGQVLAVEMRDPTSCFSSIYSQLLYAKLVIDSVDVPNRRLYARSVTDLNCGYRSVEPDSVPRN